MKTGSPTSKSTTFQTELIGKMTEFENKSTTFQTELIGKMTEFENKSTTSKGELIGKMTEFANKIPEYAREYKREYVYIRLLDYKFKYFEDNKKDAYSYEYFKNDNSYEYFKNDNVDEIIKLIKKFLKGEKKGKFKNILEAMCFMENDIQNILFFRSIAIDYLTDRRNKHNYSFDLHNNVFALFHGLFYLYEENDFLKIRVF